jgi:hypothetical protein
MRAEDIITLYFTYQVFFHLNLQFKIEIAKVLRSQKKHLLTGYYVIYFFGIKAININIKKATTNSININYRFIVKEFCTDILYFIYKRLFLSKGD